MKDGWIAAILKDMEEWENLMREFKSGATRNDETNKPDYEGFLSHAVIKRYGEYMNKHRQQADGKVRESDNWQKGIPKDAYIKSAFRHFMDVWDYHRTTLTPVGKEGLEESLCALMFNVMGYLYEELKTDGKVTIKPGQTYQYMPVEEPLFRGHDYYVYPTE